MSSRLVNLKAKESFNKDISIFKQITLNNNYNFNCIDKLLYKIINKSRKSSAYLQITHNRSINDKYYIFISCIGPLSYKLSSILKSYFNVAFTTVHPMKNQLLNNKDNIDLLLKKGVYTLVLCTLTCDD